MQIAVSLGGSSSGSPYTAATNPFNIKYAVTSVTYSESNLRAAWAAATNPTALLMVQRQYGAGWVLEFEAIAAAASFAFGMVAANAWPTVTDDLTTATGGVYAYRNIGLSYVNGVSSAYGATFAVGDKIAVGWKPDAGTLEFFKNGVSQGVAYSGLSGSFVPAAGLVSGATMDTRVATTLSYAYAGFLQWR